MSVPTIPEVDAEFILRAWLEDYTSVETVTETDASLTGPLFRLRRIGGGDDGVILDRPSFSLHAFAPDRDAARKLAYTGRTALFAARGVVWLGAVVTRVATIGGPAWVPYDNTNVRDFAGTYQISIKTA